MPSEKLVAKLNRRKRDNKFRTLSTPKGELIDFCSNDYLGLARSQELREMIAAKCAHINAGSTGSRLLTGNTTYVEALEAKTARFHGAPASLIFNSGYTANLALFSVLPQQGDTVFYDACIHASVHDGMRMGKATCIPFKHNDVDDLKRLMDRARGDVYVAVESVYSMTGDLAPLHDVLSLKRKRDFYLIIDEAHATGVYGNRGEGRVAELGMEEEVYVRMVGFGKALGCQGAALLCDKTSRDYLINYARPFIYTTALSPLSLLAADCAYDLMAKADGGRAHLLALSNCFDDACRIGGLEDKTMGERAIKGFRIAGNTAAKEAMSYVQQKGFDVRALLHPTMPRGEEQLRICLHAFNAEDEIISLVNSLMNILETHLHNGH